MAQPESFHGEKDLDPLNHFDQQIISVIDGFENADFTCEGACWENSNSNDPKWKLLARYAMLSGNKTLQDVALSGLGAFEFISPFAERLNFLAKHGQVDEGFQDYMFDEAVRLIKDHTGWEEMQVKRELLEEIDRRDGEC